MVHHPAEGRAPATRASWTLRAGMSVLMTLAATASGPSAPAQSAATRDGLLLVVSMDDARLDIVDEATLRTVGSVSTGKTPHEVRVAPDGRTAYVVAGRTITAVDLATRQASRTYDLGEHSAHDVRISRDGRRFWAACARTQAILEVDVDTGAVLRRYDVQRDGAWFVEVTPDETKLYTPNLEGTSVSVITRATGEVQVLPLEYQAYGIDITADGRHVLVSGRGVAVVDTRTDRVSRTIETTAPASGRIRITPDGARVVVAMAKSVAVFDVATGRLIRETPLPASPKVLALSDDGRRAYLTNPADRSATIVDLEQGLVVTTLPTAPRPDGIAWIPRP